MSNNSTCLSDLPIEASVIFSVEDCAAAIEMRCSDWLLDPPKGVYSNTQIEPVMTDGKLYYTLVKKGDEYIRTPVNDLALVKKGLSVYTSKGDKDSVVVTAMQLQNKNKCLSPLPIKPYRGMKILDCLLNNQIDSYIAYKKGTRDLFDAVGRHFKAECSSEEIEICFESVVDEYRDIKLTVSEFMGKHNWSIYFLKIKGSTVTIQRSIDWRAYDWMCRMESKDWS